MPPTPLESSNLRSSVCASVYFETVFVDGLEHCDRKLPHVMVHEVLVISCIVGHRHDISLPSRPLVLVEVATTQLVANELHEGFHADSVRIHDECCVGCEVADRNPAKVESGAFAKRHWEHEQRCVLGDNIVVVATSLALAG